MKIFFVLLCFVTTVTAHAQELFTYSEPASNMPAKSFALRANNYLMQNNASGNYSYRFAPEIMFGISKKLMLHAETFFGKNMHTYKFDGAALYGKYRFYTEDEVHSHFRMAAYGRVAVSNNTVMQPASELGSLNSGAEAGLVATKLINRTALSAGGSFVHATDNAGNNKFPFASKLQNAVNYNLAIGKLFIPKEYTSYEQTNVNGMLELLGQTNLGNGRTYIDLAPSVQFIVLSKMRIDAGYRFPLVTSLYRTADKGFLLRFEYNFFSAFK